MQERGGIAEAGNRGWNLLHSKGASLREEGRQFTQPSVVRAQN